MADDTQRLWMEVALRDLTGAGKDAIVRNTLEIKNATIEASRAAGELGSGGAAKEVAALGNALGGVAKIAAGVFTGIKVAELTKDLSDFHFKTMDSVGGLGSLADRFKITTDELQAYQGAARGVNVTSDELNKTLFTFNQNVGQARNGNKAALEAFERLGIKILDSHGALRPMPELLNETARALMMVENGSTRAAIGSALLGEKGARLNPLLRALEQPISDLVDRGKSFGEIVDREIIDKLDRSKNASEAADQQFRVLYATVAAPLHAKGMEYLAALTSDLTRRIREAKGSWTDMLGTIMGGHGTNATMGGLRLSTPAELAQDELKRLRGLLDNVEAKRATETNTYAQQRLDIRANDLKGKIAALEATDRSYAKETENAAAAQRLLNDQLPAKDRFETKGDSNTKPTGSGSRDRIGESVNELKLNVAAAQTAYDALRAGAKIPLEDLEREVALRKKIADEIAKLGKYDPKDPRVQQIKELVRSHEELETKIKSREVAMRDAVEIERRMGDGQAYLAAETKRLNEALDTGRLSYEAYAFAMRETADKAKDMSLNLAGSREGFEGLVAGMRYAASQWERNNRSFQLGGRLYEQVISDMNTLTNSFGDNFEQTAARIAVSWAKLLADMAMRSAASQVWNAVGGSGLFGQAAYVPAVTATTNTIPDIGTLLTGMGYADGGDPPVGMASMVGERGPELFIPKVPGTIVPNHALGGGGSSVIVQQTNHFGSDVSRAEFDHRAKIIEQRARDGAVAALIDDRRRGGPTKRAFGG